MPTQDLQVEIAYFDKMLPEWTEKHAGLFALVRGEELIGTYSNNDDAYRAGLGRFNAQPFLVRQIPAKHIDQNFLNTVIRLNHFQ